MKKRADGGATRNRIQTNAGRAASCRPFSSLLRLLASYCDLICESPSFRYCNRYQAQSRAGRRFPRRSKSSTFGVNLVARDVLRSHHLNFWAHKGYWEVTQPPARLPYDREVHGRLNQPEFLLNIKMTHFSRPRMVFLSARACNFNSSDPQSLRRARSSRRDHDRIRQFPVHHKWVSLHVNLVCGTFTHTRIF